MKVHKIIETAGKSAYSIEDVISQVIKKCALTLNNLEWFQISEIRGVIQRDYVESFQVILKVGFRVEDSANGETGQVVQSSLESFPASDTSCWENIKEESKNEKR